jgi:hypothetical protein
MDEKLYTVILWPEEGRLVKPVFRNKSLQAAREIIAGFLRRRLAGEVLGLTIYYNTTATVYDTRILSLGVTGIMSKRNKDEMLRLFLDGLGGE